ncbi:MAG TPA: hypothetical protein VH761_08440 [Ilumatobacteraceae bacterium]|jgi:hypothetical protein
MAETDAEVLTPEAGHRARIAVALSGGGHRASLFGLGALLYLVDAGKASDLCSISSISGGSLTNGYVGVNVDLASTTATAFRDGVRPLAKAVSTGGTVWARPLTYAYLASMVVVLGLASWLCFPLDGAWPLLVWAGAVIVVGWLAQKRSWIAGRSFDAVLFHGAKLSDMHTAVEHVITSCDLQTAEQVYFSGRFVHSFRLGWGEPADLRVGWAAQASACLPGAFSPVHRSVDAHRFRDPTPDAPKSFILVDGGVYDNMGTEWPMRLSRRVHEGTPPTPPPVVPDELIVVNGSAGQGVTMRRRLRVPIIGELLALLADKDVLYDQTTAVRRRLLDQLFRDRNPAGALVQIDRSPFALPRQFDRPDGATSDDLAKRARRILDALGDTEAAWQQEADTNRAVGTTLSKIPADRAARLLRHAYVLTMVNTHLLLDYPLLDIPDVDSFLPLVR